MTEYYPRRAPECGALGLLQPSIVEWVLCAELGNLRHCFDWDLPLAGARIAGVSQAIPVVDIGNNSLVVGECDVVSSFDDLVHANQCCCALVWGKLEVICTNVY